MPYDTDRDMEDFWKESGMDAPAILTFWYEDGDGKETKRTVAVAQLAETVRGDQLRGHCHLRGAIRTFSLDRINDCFDESSGQPVHDVYLHLYRIYETTPAYSFSKILSRHFDVLRAVLHVATCSGFTLSEKERVCLQVVRQLAKDTRITDKPITALLNDFQGYQADGLDRVFKLICGRLLKAHSATSRQKILGLCIKVAALKGATAQPAQECLDYMSKRFTE